MPHPFQVGVKGIIRQGEKILLLKFRMKDKGLSWDLPGGRIDGEETIEEAFAREAKEELPGISDPVLTDIVHAQRAPRNFENREGLLWLFYTATATINHLEEQTDHEGYRWVDQEEFTNLVHEKDISLPEAFKTAISKAFL